MSDVPISAPTTEPSSFITVTSANQFDEQADFTDHIVSSLRQNNEYHVFIFTGVPPSWADAVYQLIDENSLSKTSRKSYNSKSRELRIRVMHTEIINSIQSWLFHPPMDWFFNGDITRQEVDLFYPGVGTTLYFKSGPYSGSWKEPDLFFLANYHILPTLAVESGWSEEKEQLHKGMDLSLVGGNGTTKVVIIVEWTKLNEGRVSGTVELFVRDSNGMPALQQSETIFPRPATPNDLWIRRRDLLGPALLPDRNGDDMLYFNVERLRDKATGALGLMDLVPA
ncbi:hypothetical protein Asppvi_003646 [Aspergillus pseudoviridinutans]|uniref:Uncharacterized protein n=1 Tax=Aspergillus pseudoviridinutans TaxID=1517512 RepID=A0A9P3B8Q8_9EURO|nr:uncharacterized protein Asppvi_003646 [Aspergillus pseudoviridinutans]GIJ84795.1 hypothetical protein Asppvi_003646 [Aspergillus pseudoviridinutans]